MPIESLTVSDGGAQCQRTVSAHSVSAQCQRHNGDGALLIFLKGVLMLAICIKYLFLKIIPWFLGLMVSNYIDHMLFP